MFASPRGIVMLRRVSRQANLCTATEAQLKPVLESVSKVSAGEQYDLRAAGSSSAQSFETSDGSPTDITSSLTRGSVGYNRRYADGWDRIFGRDSTDGQPEETSDL